MTKPKLTLLVFALIGALFVVGCGGSDNESSSQAGNMTAAENAGPLTREEFIERADEICAKADDREYYRVSAYREEHKKELNKFSPIPREEKIIRIFVLPAIERQIEELEALEAPEGDEKKIEKIITSMKVGLKQGEKSPYSVSFEVPTEYPFEELSDLASSYGLSECSNPT